MFHGHHRPGDAPLLGLRRHLRVGHEAVHLSAQPGQNGLVDARFGHLGIGYNVAAVFQSLQALLHGVVRKHQILHIGKIRGGVNHPLDYRGLDRVQFGVPQQLGDDFKASFFNLSWFHGLQHDDVSPFGKPYRNSGQTPDWHKNGNGGIRRTAWGSPRRRPRTFR